MERHAAAADRAELDAQWALQSHHDGHLLLPRLIRYIEERRREERSRTFTSAGVDHVTLDTVQDYAPVLRRAFAQRAKRMSR